MRRHALLETALVVFAVLGAPSPAGAGTPAEQERSDEPPDIETTSQPSSRPRLRAFVSAGASYGEVFGVGLRSGRIDGGAVLDTSRRFGVTFAAGHEAGETSFGLFAGDVYLYASFDVILGRLRLGIGPDLTYFWMTPRRASSAGRNIDAFGTGLRLHAGVDAVALGEGRALYVGATAETQWLRGGVDFVDVERGAIGWRLGATVGVRF